MQAKNTKFIKEIMCLESKKFLFLMIFCSKVLTGINYIDDNNNDYMFLTRRVIQEYCNLNFSTWVDPWKQCEEDEVSSFKPDAVLTGSIVFVRTFCLTQFFTKVHRFIKNPYILVTHIDDHDIPSGYKNYLKDPKIIAWFSINALMQGCAKLIPIPIGVNQDRSIYKNQKEINNIFYKMRNHQEKKALLYMNFSVKGKTGTVYKERMELHELFKEKCFCTVGEMQPFTEYLEEMARHKFALCPRGAGQDTYRTWEALLVGTIPIVLRSNLNSLYAGLPVLIVDSWSMITEEFLEAKYNELTNKKYSIKKLYSKYWLKKIIKKAKSL